ncbi:MAG: response regulator [Alphaproteobacteria bacterium]|nr:response regulator [Alphaproteobacteria bacterium]
MNQATASRMVILLAEDNAEMREFVMRALELLGHRAIDVGDGASALAKLAERADLNVLLTDVMLPGGLNGAELARTARGLRPDLKILFMSGYAETAIDANELRQFGAFMLAKPFRVQQLDERLKALWTKPRPAALLS